MNNTIIRLLSAVILLSGLQSSLYPQGKLKIAVIPKGKQVYFWKSVQAGVNIGAIASSGVEINWKSAQIENDKAQQISLVEQSIAEGVSGIVLAPVDNAALAVPVANAMKHKIPVLIFDSELKGTPGKDFISFVGTDNRKAGSLAGEHLAKLLKGEGKVVLLRNMLGHANFIERIEGFMNTIAKVKGIQLIVKNISAGATAEDVKKICTGMIDTLKEADGVFCINESSTMGMLSVLRSANLAGKIKFIGFDASTVQIEALKNGEISALIAQDPSRIGYSSIKTIVDFIRGRKIPLSIDTGVYLITRENINNPEIKKLYSMSGKSE